MKRPYTIKIFVPAGDPEGIRIIEKSNWSGAGLVIPRALFGEGKLRREMARTGVYVLVGPPEESGLPRVYVGEGDPIRPRLEQHAARKDFWTTCFAFTSKAENVNKAHVQFLEARLVGLASEAKRCTLDNGNAPALPSMSEADAADAEGFLSEMLLCFSDPGAHGLLRGVALPSPRTRVLPRHPWGEGRRARDSGGLPGQGREPRRCRRDADVPQLHTRAAGGAPQERGAASVGEGSRLHAGLSLRLTGARPRRSYWDGRAMAASSGRDETAARYVSTRKRKPRHDADEALRGLTHLDA